MEKFIHFHALYKKVKDIAALFFICKRILYSYSKDGVIKRDNHYLLFYNAVINAFNTLDIESKTFINNEFFFEAYPYWWKDKISYPIFKVKIKNSMHKFLEALYEII